MRYILTFFVIGAMFLSGCSSSKKEDKPSPLDSYWTSKDNTIANKKFTAPKKWAAGQYVVMGLLDKGKRESVAKMTIVRKEKTGWVYEVINIDKKGKTTGAQICVEGLDNITSKKDLDNINFIWRNF